MPRRIVSPAAPPPCPSAAPPRAAAAASAARTEGWAFDQEALMVDPRGLPSSQVCRMPSPARPFWAPGSPVRAAAQRRVCSDLVAAANATAGERRGLWEQALATCLAERLSMHALLAEATVEAGGGLHLLERLLPEDREPAADDLEMVAQLLPMLPANGIYRSLIRLDMPAGIYLGRHTWGEQRSLRHGRGLLRLDNDVWISGTWAHDLPQGRMRVREPGRTWVGGLDGQLRRCGAGKLFFEGGEIVSGHWPSGGSPEVAHIHWPHQDGRTYHGAVSFAGPAGRPLPHGAGAMQWPRGGQLLEADFHHGRAASGTLHFAADHLLGGWWYRGPLQRLVPHGEGWLMGPAGRLPCRFVRGELMASDRVNALLSWQALHRPAPAGASQTDAGRTLAMAAESRYHSPHEGSCRPDLPAPTRPR